MLGFSREKQIASIAHGCASTICAVADYFAPGNKAHGVDAASLRQWALGRGIALDQLPARLSPGQAREADTPVRTVMGGALAFGPASLTAEEQEKGCCWFRRADPQTGQRPVCPFHPRSPASTEGEEVSPELHKIYRACGRRATHEARKS